jgi:hypothetical protein
MVIDQRRQIGGRLVHGMKHCPPALLDQWMADIMTMNLFVVPTLHFRFSFSPSSQEPEAQRSSSPTHLIIFANSFLTVNLSSQETLAHYHHESHLKEGG